MRKIICICFAFVISGNAFSQTSKQLVPKGVKQANKGIKIKKTTRKIIISTQKD
jgi:hypothetical protein